MISTLPLLIGRRKETLMEVEHKGKIFLLALSDCSEIRNTVHRLGYLEKIDQNIVNEMGTKFFYPEIDLSYPRFSDKKENLGIMLARLNGFELRVAGSHDRLLSLWLLCNLFQCGKIFCMNCRQPDDRCQVGLFLSSLRNETKKGKK